jgi:putative salt-induced outer membrane protein YdiY
MQTRPPVRPFAATVLRLAAAGLVGAPLLVHAQVTLKPDDQWRALFTAGATASGGNTRAKSISLSGEAVKLTDHDKWDVTANGQYATNNGVRNTDRDSGTALYSRDVTPKWFGFGQVDLLHDALADISSRATLGTGLGYHVFKEPAVTWDLSGGVAYTMDRYKPPQVIDDELRSRYNHADLLFAEESNHKFSETTTFRQKLTVYPDLRDNEHVRTVFDTGLSVAMTKRLALTATFEHRYDSRPAAGLGRNDTQLVTGVSLRFD